MAAAGSRTSVSDSIRTAVERGGCPNQLPFGADKGGEHCCSHLAAETFDVRGPRYLTDKVKSPAGPAAFDLMHVEMFMCNDKIGNVAARDDSFLRKARAAGDDRYYLIINYVTPAKPFIHLIMYYAVDSSKVASTPQLSKLWRQFTAHGPAADEFRNDRWKVIPRIAEGSWIVSSAVGTKPALLAQKLTHTWIICDDIDDAPTGGAGATGGSGSAAAATKSVETADTGCGDVGGRAHGESFVTHSGPGPYIEADCDVASSSIAHMLVSLLQQYAKYIVIDLGFAIEPRSDDECPEIVLGTVRLSRIDVTKPVLVKAAPTDQVLGALGVTHGETTEEEE